MQIQGTLKQLQSNVPIILALGNMLRDKDVGNFMGSLATDYLRNVKTSSLQLCCFWSVYPKPPFWKPQSNGKVIRAECTVPNIKRSKMDYETIKQVMGGKNGYLWGRFWGAAQLSCGGRIRVFAGSENEAEQRIDALASLSNSEILGVLTGEEKPRNSRAKNNNAYKDTIRIYPNYISVINTEKLFLDERKGRTQLDGKFDSKKSKKLTLWEDNKMSWFDSAMTEALKRGNNTQ